MTKFEREQNVLMRYRLLAVWLSGSFLLGVGLRELSTTYPPGATALLLVLACTGLVMLAFGYSTVHALRDEAIQRRDHNQAVLDTHESLK